MMHNWNCPTCLTPVSQTDGEPADPSQILDAPDDMAAALARLKLGVKIFKRVPKPVRSTVAGLLAEQIDLVLGDPTKQNWWNLLSFTYKFLRTHGAERENADASSVGTKERPTVARTIRENIKNTERTVDMLANLSLRDAEQTTSPSPMQVAESVPVDAGGHGGDPTTPEQLRRRVGSKLADGDVRGALRILTTDDSISPNSAETFEALQRKHPPAPHGDAIQSRATEQPALQTDAQTVLAAINSMPSGSSGGLDGLRPRIVQQLVSKETAESGVRLLSSLTKLVNHALAGRMPDCARPSLFGASLFALEKPEGGVRPIAVGSVFRRLPAKIAAQYASTQLQAELAPAQVGVGTRGGCESAVHALRQYATATACPDSPCIIVKCDIKNAFNSVHRTTVLDAVFSRCPEIFPMAFQSYSASTPLYHNTSLITSESGVQQGDPLGPLLFSLAIDPIIQSIETPFNLWYLDDGTLAGPANQVIETISSLIPQFEAIGLTFNPSKCEVSSLGDGGQGDTLSSLRGLLPGVRVQPLGELSLLG